MSKFSETLKKIFTRVVDEAEAEEKKEEGKGKDSESAPSQGQPAVMDDLMKMMKDMYDKVEALSKPKDEAAAAAEKKEEKKAGDEGEKKEDKPAEDAEVEAGLEARLKKVEELLAKIMQAESAEAGDEDEGEGEGDGDDQGESQESGDAAFMTGDDAARAEILSPGIKDSKDFKAKALKTAYDTKEGKEVIDSLSAGKPTFDSASSVDTLFIAASEVLKAKRGVGLAGSKNSRSFDSAPSQGASFKTAEELNKIHEEFWKNRK
jgi:hypothetical protein